MSNVDRPPRQLAAAAARRRRPAALRPRPGRVQGRIQDVDGGAAGLRLGQGRRDLPHLVQERTNGRINIKQYPGASLVQGQQDREFSAMRQGVIDVLCGAPINWTSHGAAARRVHPAVPDARPQGLRRGDGQRSVVNRDYFEHGAQGRRRAAGDRRDRLPADQQQQAADAQARRPQGPQGARGRQPDVRRDHERRWARIRPS